MDDGADMHARNTKRRDRRVGRGRVVRRLVLAAVALAIALALYRSQRPPPTELVLELPLLTRIQTLAEGLHREVVLCLTGRVRGNTAIADGFEMPTPRLSTPTRSSFDPCPRGTLASWHNHPPITGPVGVVAGSPFGSDAERARRLCVLSQTDIQTAARLRHPFVVVSVDAKTWCWWRLSEVDRFAEQSIAPGPPSPERLARADEEAAWARPSADAATDDILR